MVLDDRSVSTRIQVRGEENVASFIEQSEEEFINSKEYKETIHI